VPDARAVTVLLADLGQIPFRIDQDLAPLAIGVGGAFLERGAGGVTATVVDDDGAQLPQHGSQQGELLQMVAGDEGHVVELIIGGEAVAPALVLRGDDEGAGRDSFLAARLDADAREQAHGLHHTPDIAADDPACGLAARRQGRKGGGQAVGDGKRPIGDVEQQASHLATMPACRSEASVK